MAKLFRNRFYRLTIDTKNIVGKVNDGVAKGMDKIAKIAEREIKKITPVGKTGNLKRSVTVRAITKTKSPRLEVRTIARGLFVEKGTVNMAAQPFIEPVMRGQRNRWRKIVAAEGRKFINKQKKKRK